MKKFLPFFLLIITGSIYQAKSQNLLDTNNRWNTLLYTTFYGYGTYQLSISGDTIINQLTYQKVYKTNDSSGNNRIYYAAIRENNSAQKVFIIRSLNPNEILLYDFGLAVGDTFQFQHHFFNYNTILDSITYVMLKDSSIVKKFNFNNVAFSDTYWIQGIGSSFGLDYGDLYCCESNLDLICFYKNNQLIYQPPHPFVSDCYVPYTGINTINKINVTISPNPASNSFKIKGEQLLSYQLTDLNGKIIQANTISSDDEIISITSISSGLYFLKVVGKEGIAVKKLVIN